jgi:membrane protease YdiL (CAAX protease family)
VLCAVVLLAYMAAITWAFPSPAMAKFHSINFHENLWPEVALMVLIISVGPVAEELVFRGSLWADLKAYWSAPGVMLFTGLTFLVMHVSHCLKLNVTERRSLPHPP